MDYSTITPTEWVDNENTFLNLLADKSNREQIPLMNVNEWYQINSSSLVRFHGMIQDMHSPEYYLEKVEVVNQNTNEKLCRISKYCDIVANETECIDFDSEKNVPAERQTYVVISVPGVNNWAQGIEENDFKIDFNKHLSGTGSKKRSHEQSMDVEECPIPDTSHNIGSKKICNGNSSGSDNHSAASVRDLSSTFPIPNKSNKICHLKVYKDQEGLKLNEVYEFIGFLATDAVMDPVLNKEDENSMEFNTLHPPTSLVPRIHCVSYTKLVNQNPLLRNETDPADSVKLDVIRKELLVLLKQLLLGDDLAAEYLLLHLISEVYARRNFLPLGKFSLNISNIPGLDNLDFVGELYKFIEKLVHKSFYLPMTLENLNDLSFIPKKDYESNSLISGILQLSGNTHVVLDETKLSPGKLNAAGINNVKAIASAIKDQKVAYDFNYYPIEYDCDIPFLILSEGKSMLHSDVHIPLRPDPTCIKTFKEILQAADHFLKPALSDGIRRYLTLARLTPYKISDNVEGLIQEEFVEMRQRGTVTADDLHNLLVLARLVSISQGKTSLDEESWKKACDLDKERKNRSSK